MVTCEQKTVFYTENGVEFSTREQAEKAELFDEVYAAIEAELPDEIAVGDVIELALQYFILTPRPQPEESPDGQT